MAHWYVNSPGVSNVCVNVSPWFRCGDENEPSSAVTVCAVLSSLVHCTVVPSAIPSGFGEKLKFWMVAGVALAAVAGIAGTSTRPASAVSPKAAAARPKHAVHPAPFVVVARMPVLRRCVRQRLPRHRTVTWPSAHSCRCRSVQRGGGHRGARGVEQPGVCDVGGIDRDALTPGAVAVRGPELADGHRGAGVGVEHALIHTVGQGALEAHEEPRRVAEVGGDVAD